jgi:hypothetical protein
MHFHPILLVQADNLEEAKTLSEDFCGRETGEHAYFDYGGIVADKDTQWNKPLSEVISLLPPDDHIEKALRFVSQAEEMFKKGDRDMAGHYYKKAGLLFEQSFCTESSVFNIRFNDYSRVFEEGWYAIEADFHG